MLAGCSEIYVHVRHARARKMPKSATIAENQPLCSEIEAAVGPKEAKIALALAGCSEIEAQGRPVSHRASAPA